MADLFGALLQRARLRAGMTQEQLAERAGVSVRTIRRFETDANTNPRVETVRLLADALRLPPAARDELLASAVGATEGPLRPVPQQLPALPQVFVGRTDELNALSVRTGGATVVVSAVSGGGGIGKTWLALQWAHEHLAEFPDGQLFVDLRGFSPKGRPVPSTHALRGFLDALGVEPAKIPADLDAQTALYRTLVADKRMLIVLDNARDSEQAAPLLPGGSACTAVVTSRDRLAGLVTAHGAHPIVLDVLDETQARELMAARLGHDRLAAEPDAAAELLGYCAGLPLALAVVAARAALQPDTSLARLVAELRDASSRIDALDAGETAANVRAALSWTHSALSPRQAETFALLGLAPGPEIGLAAAAVLTDLPEPEVRRALAELERISLVRQAVPERYRMHDLVKLFAADQAREVARPQRQAALRRLVDHYLHTAYTADRKVNPQRDPVPLRDPVDGSRPRSWDDEPSAWAWLTTERSNLVAVQHLAADEGWHAQVGQLAWVLHTVVWRLGGSGYDLEVWQAALTAAEQANDMSAQTQALRYLGRAHAVADRREEAVHYLERALDAAESIGDVSSQAYTHFYFAMACEDEPRAREHSAHAVRLAKTLDNPMLLAHALNGLGWDTARMGEYEQSRRHCAEALELFRGLRDKHGEAAALDSLGYIHRHVGEYEQAADCHRQARDLCRELGDVYNEADTLDHLAQACQAIGRTLEAEQAWQQALSLYLDQDRAADVARVHDALGQLAHTLDNKK
ncbi:ATP-binding protein [Nocardia pseudobrasiliensis]|uniref:NB-ARC domain-containing protein n=1 Tax=Nocardia pseudobrasiliensis TaxID=45979 RepID=A0A370HWU8_9NOCA|nr:helix-turn-helix domain-containing protein [Nocardia pseudobrasiliensis]RDI62750.1 NB-ARC domain-containing protein [Nocardia pseudobrasiliensis]